jgi:exonuclease SbcC
MKVLAIRGENLASLAGLFEVDFERPPLAGAGLFAITGPTGSGKSTLLDALCLALFGQTPRGALAGTLDVPVGGTAKETLTAQDPRNLLRRGAGEGFAEADFVGTDGRRYRARWEVRRARRLPGGKFQNASRALSRLDGGREERVAEGVQETEAKVAEVLGLTFEQFRKAVLLAQGDFAAFLRAKEKERSELLEKITGAEIYSKLSRRAFERARDVRARLDGMQAALDRLAPFGEEARKEREAGVERLREETAALDVRRRRLEEAARLATEAGEREREAAKASEAKDAALQAADEKVRAEESAVETKRRAEEALAAARSRREERAPDVDSARVLDARLSEKETERTRLAAEVRKAREEVEAARARAARLEEELRAARVAKERAETWLAERAADEPLVHGWDATRRNLGALARGREELDLARREADAAAASEEELKESAARFAGEEAKVSGALKSAGAQAQAAEEASTAIDRGRISASLAEVGREVAALAALEPLAAATEAELSRLAEAERSVLEGRERAAQESAAAGEAEREAHHLETRAAEIAAAREKALAERGLAARRAALVPGEPCPLCGSPEHPWGAGGTAPADRADALDAERQALLKEGRERAKAGAAHGEGAKAAERRAKEAARAGGEAGRALARLRTEWEAKGRELPPGAPLREAPATAEETVSARQRIGAALGIAHERQEALQREQERAAALERAAQEARGRRETAARAAEAAAKAVRDAEKELEQLRTRRAVLATRIDGLEGKERLLREELDRLVAEDAEAARLLGSDPARLAALWEARVAAWRTQAGERERATAEAGRLAPLLSAEESTRSAAEATRTDQERRAAGVEGAYAALVAERTALLGGRAVAEVVAEMDAAARTAEVAQRRAVEAASEAGAERARAIAALEAAEKGAVEAARKVESALAEREAARAAAGLEAAPDGTRMPVADALAAAARDRARTEEALGRAQAELIADDRTREERKAALAEKEKAEREGRVWLSLGDLIGEASGGKLRRFAQEMTLQALVANANHHLRDFARRYQLRKAPGTEVGLLVVDRDMGDELRSVESLSGGETFLVSLALALGLASLATKRAAIGSLFVDEGFGSLDADTLERAVSALDAVREGGRRIGLISHVEGLAEKIGVEVRIVARGGGRSEVRVIGA